MERLPRVSQSMYGMEAVDSSLTVRVLMSSVLPCLSVGCPVWT